MDRKLHTDRRSVVKLLGASAFASGIGTTPAAADRFTGSRPDDPDDQDPGHETPEPELEGLGEIHLLGHTLGSDPAGGYAEEHIRWDGEMALLGSFFGEGGSFLFDIRNPTDPTEVHRLRSSPQVRNADVKFDSRDGLYYRTQEPNEEDAPFAGIEVVDYGYDAGSPESPIIIATPENGATHNLMPHPDRGVDILYAQASNEVYDASFTVWDVSDPFNPEFVMEGPPGGAHDIVVEEGRDLLHFAGHLEPEGQLSNMEAPSYAWFDISDPANPQLVGALDVAQYPTLEEVGLSGELGFDHGGGHKARGDPERNLAVVSDETGQGVPAMKVVVDIGWEEGSLQDPEPIGWTRSPRAQLMDEVNETFAWTTHNHVVIPKPDATLLASGDYREGTVVYDITDPRNPTPADVFDTDLEADEADGPDPDFVGGPPMAWGADYNSVRDLTITGDMHTGLYVYSITPS